MSYSAPRLPRLIFGLIGGSIIALFALLLLSLFGPKLFEAYQIWQIERCEADHKIRRTDKSGLFSFDAGGWKVLGDTNRKQSFIECLRGRLDVRTSSISDEPHPTIEIWEYSFSYGLDLTYYPASTDGGAP